MRILVRSVALALAIGVVPLTSVAAHECIVVNRSATGNQHASGSGQWITVTLTQIYEETEDHPPFEDLTPAQVAYATELAASWGVPGSFTFRSDTLLPASEAWEESDHDADGKGIDHFFDVYGERIIGAYLAARLNA